MEKYRHGNIKGDGKTKGGTRMAKKSIIEGDGMLENERFLLNSNSTYDCLLIAPQDRG